MKQPPKITVSRLEGFEYLADVLKLPLHKAIPPAKHPGVTGWQNESYRPFKDIGFNRNHNAVVLTGDNSSLIVLDIDDKTLFPSTYEIPDTFTVKTGNGYHHYFLIPEAYKGRCENRTRKELGFDIRANGGCTVAPYSMHDTGKKYEIVNFNDGKFTEAPEWLLELSVKSSSKPSSSSPAKKIPTISIAHLTDGTYSDAVEKVISKYGKLVTESGEEGSRSERIYRLINKCIQDDFSDDEILAVFENNRSGVGEKYAGKGGSRVSWLQSQISKAREEMAKRYIGSVKAKDQASVAELLADILASLERYSGITVPKSQKEALEKVVNLFIALYEKSITGWYCIPMGVGTGKTQTVLHFIKFLAKHDIKREFSVAFSLERIDEINESYDELIKAGVPSDYVAKVHSKTDPIPLEKLKDHPVIIHTHYKMRGYSYKDELFSYRGKPRRLMIFDESMQNGLSTSCHYAHATDSIRLFLTEYAENPDLMRSLDEKYHLFFQDLLNTLQEGKNATEWHDENETQELLLPELISNYSELMRARQLITQAVQERVSTGGSKAEENSFYEDVLQIANSDKDKRKATLVKKKSSLEVHFSKEIIHSDIDNLITLDASRPYRTLFNYTQRKDGKQVKIYGETKPLSYHKLHIIGRHWVTSSKVKIENAFDHKIDPDDTASTDSPEFLKKWYLRSLILIIKERLEHWKENSTKGVLDDPTPPKPLRIVIFVSKKVNLKDSLKGELLDFGIIERGQFKDLISFATFGQSNATNQFRDCQVVISIGEKRVRPHVTEANLQGEGVALPISRAITEDVAFGDLLTETQQRIGRGAIRNGEEMWYYFFDIEPYKWASGLAKCFPGCDIQIKDAGPIPSTKKGSPSSSHKKEEEKNREYNFNKACKDKGIPADDDLRKEFLGQKLTQVKFLKKKGLI